MAKKSLYFSSQVPSKKSRDAATTAAFLSLANRTLEVLDGGKQLVLSPLATIGSKTAGSRKEVASVDGFSLDAIQFDAYLTQYCSNEILHLVLANFSVNSSNVVYRETKTFQPCLPEQIESCIESLRDLLVLAKVNKTWCRRLLAILVRDHLSVFSRTLNKEYLGQFGKLLATLHSSCSNEDWNVTAVIGDASSTGIVQHGIFDVTLLGSDIIKIDCHLDAASTSLDRQESVTSLEGGWRTAIVSEAYFRYDPDLSPHSLPQFADAIGEAFFSNITTLSLYSMLDERVTSLVEPELEFLSIATLGDIDFSGAFASLLSVYGRKQEILHLKNADDTCSSDLSGYRFTNEADTCSVVWSFNAPSQRQSFHVPAFTSGERSSPAKTGVVGAREHIVS